MELDAEAGFLGGVASKGAEATTWKARWTDPLDARGRGRSRLFDAVRWTCLLIVTIFMLSIEIGKPALSDEEEPAYQFFRYLTNISWTLETAFYALATVFWFQNEAFRTLLFAAYFPILGQTILVFVLVNVVFGNTDAILRESAAAYGLGTTVTGNSVFHDVPVMLSILFGALFADDLYATFLYFRERERREWARVLMLVYEGYAPTLLLGLYDAIADPHDVYRVNEDEWKDWVGWVVALVVYTAVFLGATVFFYLSPGDKHD